MDSLQARLIQCFSAVFPQLSDEQIVNADQQSLSEWDSLKTVMLWHLLQEEFQVNIEPEEAEHLISFSDISRLLGHRLGAGDGYSETY